MGLFSAIKSGLAKTRDALMGELKGIVGAGKITDDTLEELEEHLIKADVGVEAAFLLTDALREQALGKSLTTEQVLDIMRGEAERLLKDPPPFELKGKPHVILVIGVNGAGKTTTIGKLAARFIGEGKKVMIAACDTFRAAAIEQLETWAERSGAEFVKHQEGSDPAAVAFDACQAAVARGCDVVLVDTAGRLHNKDYLMEELKNHSGRSSMLVLRPADAAETSVCWKMAMENNLTPTALILSRQNIDDLPAASGNRYQEALGAERGGYIINKVENPDVTLVGNGSEVATLVAAADIIKQQGIRAQVVSVPSTGLFLRQDEDYRQQVIPCDVPAFGLTAGLPSTLRSVVPHGCIYGLDHFGASAPYKVLDEKFGFTPQKVAEIIHKVVQNQKK